VTSREKSKINVTAGRRLGLHRAKAAGGFWLARWFSVGRSIDILSLFSKLVGPRQGPGALGEPRDQITGWWHGWPDQCSGAISSFRGEPDSPCSGVRSRKRFGSRAADEFFLPACPEDPVFSSKLNPHSSAGPRWRTSSLTKGLVELVRASALLRRQRDGFQPANGKRTRCRFCEKV